MIKTKATFFTLRYFQFKDDLTLKVNSAGFSNVRFFVVAGVTIVKGGLLFPGVAKTLEDGVAGTLEEGVAGTFGSGGALQNSVALSAFILICK